MAFGALGFGGIGGRAAARNSGVRGIVDQFRKIKSGDETDVGRAPSFDLEGLLAAEEERKRLSRRRGRASTILAGRQPGGSGTRNLGTRMLLGS